MIYKFNNESDTLEVEPINNGVSLWINGEERIDLSKKELYSLIGALHSIQTNLKKA
jgi:hypothetical protein